MCMKMHIYNAYLGGVGEGLTSGGTRSLCVHCHDVVSNLLEVSEGVGGTAGEDEKGSVGVATTELVGDSLHARQCKFVEAVL